MQDLKKKQEKKINTLAIPLNKIVNASHFSSAFRIGFRHRHMGGKIYMHVQGKFVLFCFIFSFTHTLLLMFSFVYFISNFV